MPVAVGKDPIIKEERVEWPGRRKEVGRNHQSERKNNVYGGWVEEWQREEKMGKVGGIRSGNR